MGADYFFFRGCRLQTALGPERFSEAVKQRAQLATLECLREELEARTGKPLEELAVRFGDSAEPSSFRELQHLASAVQDTQDCAACPLASGHALGCYTSITYPVDAEFEELFFEYFVEALTSGDPVYAVGRDTSGATISAAALIRQVLIGGLPPRGPWHEQRGPAAQGGGLAERAAPLCVELAGERLDSAQVLAAAFAPALDDLDGLLLYAHLYVSFLGFLERRGVESASSTLEEITQLTDLLQAAAGLARTAPVSVLVSS